MDLTTELETFSKIFKPYSKRYFSGRIKSASKYPSLIGGFYRDLEDFSSGGKKIRPFLVYLAYQVGSPPSRKASVDKILPVCLAVELIHNCFLIQDDVIDKSDKRRGKMTIHKRFEEKFGYHYGVSQAIMASDIVCFEAFRLINSADFDEGLKKLAHGRFVKTLLETVYGEALDVEYSYKETSLQYIRQMTDLKTARYSFVGPLAVGAILGGVKMSQIKILEKYGLLVGTAFQLQDDILGVFGDEEILGKSVLSDLREGKNTILIYKTREMVKKRILVILNKKWGRQDAEVSDLRWVQGVMKISGALDWCEGEKFKLIKEAKKRIGDMTSDKNLQLVFAQLADFVIGREK